MASTINASSTANGIVSTADASGRIFLQSNGVNTNAQAWVNFVGSTATINASYNVSSITRIGTGNYAVNFTNAMTDANYSAVAMSGSPGVIDTLQSISTTTPTSSVFYFICRSYAAVSTDPAIVNVIVFR